MYEQNAKEEYRNQTVARAGLVGSIGGTALQQPPTPSMRARLHETLGYLGELDEIHGQIRAELQGNFPSPPGDGKIAAEPSIEQMIEWICQRTACAVGEAKSLRARL